MLSAVRCYENSVKSNKKAYLSVQLELLALCPFHPVTKLKSLGGVLVEQTGHSMQQLLSTAIKSSYTITLVT